MRAVFYIKNNKRMSYNPIISVIIPAYNSEKYIDRCIESLVNQTINDYELLIINDGSTDSTLGICKKLSSKYRNIRVLNQNNKGVSEARNYGMVNAIGDFIAFVDSDDFVEPNYLETLLHGIQKNNADLSAVTYTHESVSCKNTMPFYDKKLVNTEDALNLIACDIRYAGYLWNKLFRKDILTKYSIKFDSHIKIWEDMLFCIEYTDHINKAFFIDAPLYHYIDRPGSAVNNSLIWKHYTQLSAIESIKRISEKYPKESPFVQRVNFLWADQYITAFTDRKYLQNMNKKEATRILTEIGSMKVRLGFNHQLRFWLYKIVPFKIWKLFSSEN